MRGAPGALDRIGGLFRIVHPFPSALDALATAAIALLAGAAPGVALRLAVGMLGLQFSIGIANDVADEPADRLGRPTKPLVRGTVTPRLAVAALCVTLVVGVAAAASVSVAAIGIGAAGLGLGVLYDLWLKGTPLSWLPFALGVGLLPVYAWWGGTGCLPVGLVGVFAMAVVAGAALAVSNAAVDRADDVRAGVRSVATLLGERWSVALDAVLLLVLGVVALGSSFAIAPLTVTAMATQVAGFATCWLGLLATAWAARWPRHPSGWEIEAIGVALLGAGWVAALVAGGRLVC